MPTSHQPDPNVERLRQQQGRDDKERDRRIRKLEADATYLRRQLLPYLRGLAAAIPYPLPPDPPA